MKVKSEKSLFANALTHLLDDTDLFDRADWADVLSVSTAAISQWVNDKTIPQPDYLYTIYEMVKGSDLPSEEPLINFREIAKLPAYEVSPHGRRMLPNIWSYMTRPVFDDLSKKLARLAPEEQEHLLESIYSGGTGSQTPQTIFIPAITLEGRQSDSGTRGGVRIGSFPPVVRQPGPASLWPGVRCLYSRDDATCIDDAVSSFEGTRFIPPALRLVEEESDENIESQEVHLDNLLRFKRVLITGQPGSGKSMAVRWLARELVMAYSRRQSQDFPIYVHFNCLSVAWPSSGLEELVCSFIPADNENARLTFIVDGLDEAILYDRGHLIRNVSDFLNENSEVKFVATSRPMSDLNILEGLTRLEIQPLTDLALNRWIFGSLSEGKLKSEKQKNVETFIAQLSERPEVLTTLRNPLFLSVSAGLFKRNGLTAFYEADIFNECLWLLLDEWERCKKVVRMPHPWARPHRLYNLLSDLSYHCLRSNSHRFTTEQAASWMWGLNYDAPIEPMLSLLSEMTGLLQRSSDKHWSFTHRVFQEYLAARYAVESSRNTAEILGESFAPESLQNVFRLACSITNDASPLIKFALEGDRLMESDQSVLLADIIAQDITAERSLINTACDRVVRWLSDALLAYTVEPHPKYDPQDASKPRWQLQARSRNASATLENANGKRVRRVLKSLHQARSSPVRGTLVEKLAGSPSGVVREFSNCVNVEGRYKDRVVRSDQVEHFLAEVYEVPGVA
jgi:hypothetical protein